MAFSDTFAYPDGTLTGNGLWAAVLAFPALTVAAARILYNATAPHYNAANLAGLGFQPPLPFTAAIRFKRSVVADTDGQLQFIIGDIAGTPAGVVISWSPGDGAADMLSNIDLADGNGGDNGSGPLASITADEHTVQIDWDGADLTATLDAGPATAISPANLAGVTPVITVSAYNADATDTIEILEVDVTQPP